MYLLDIQSLADLFSNKSEAYRFLKDNNIPVDEFMKEAEDKNLIAPKFEDLARLLYICETTNVDSILEYGCGFSTYIFHNYLSKTNNNSEKKTNKFLQVFEVHKNFLELATSRLKENPIYLKTSYKNCEIVYDFSRNDGSHYYEAKYSFLPDLIYLDGPSHYDVPNFETHENSLNTFSLNTRPSVSSDILSIESWLSPGTILVIDGREANVRYLKSKCYRNWEWADNKDSKITVAFLNEDPIGKYNKSKLHERRILG